MLHITIPFVDRNHPGPWMLVGDDGWAVIPTSSCHDEVIDGLRAIQPMDQRTGVTTQQLERMVEDRRLCLGHIHVTASPFPGSQVA